MEQIKRAWALYTAYRNDPDTKYPMEFAFWLDQIYAVTYGGPEDRKSVREKVFKDGYKRASALFSQQEFDKSCEDVMHEEWKEYERVTEGN